MNNNNPVIFSTWGFKYAPPVDFHEEEIISGVENYLLENQRENLSNMKTKIIRWY